MLQSRGRMNRIVAIGVVVFGIGAGVLFAYLRRPEVHLYMNRQIPLEGLVVNPRGVNLGNPENAVKDLRRIGQAMLAYRSEHGALPPLAVLLNTSKPISSTVWLTDDDFKNPDSAYSDSFDPEDQGLSRYGFAFLAPRPDGRPKPAYPKAGERDVWLVCNDYYRSNTRVAYDRRGTLDIRGVYVVLWSDGNVEKIPAAKTLFTKSGSRSMTMGFPGEAGMPKVASTLAETYESDTFNKVRIDGQPLKILRNPR